jgi:diphthamide biosynthesis methyltransferase
MVLYIVGLGLGDEKDVTIKGKEAIEKCSKIFLEAYTSILGIGKERLVESLFNLRKILIFCLSRKHFMERLSLLQTENLSNQTQTLFLVMPEMRT